MKENKTLKIISYILLPILIGIIMIALVYSLAKDSYYTQLNTYFQTTDFEEEYISSLSRLAKRAIYLDDGYKYNYENKNFSEGTIYYYKEEGENRIYYIDLNNQKYNLKLMDNYVLIKYKDKVVTNVNNLEEVSVESIKQFIENQEGQKVNIVKGQLKSTSFKGSGANYRNNFTFNYYHTEIEDKNDKDSTMVVSETAVYEDFEIYSTYKEEFVLNDYDKFVIEAINKVSKYEDVIYFMVPINSVLIIIISVYLIMSIGHTKGKDGIDLNDLDKIPLEILAIILGIIVAVGNAVIFEIGLRVAEEYYKLVVSGIITEYFVIYTLTAIAITTIIKRIKSKTFMESSIIGKILKWCKKVIIELRNVSKEFTKSMKNTSKLIMYTILYLIIMLLIIAIFENEFGVFLDIAITIYVFYQIIKRINCFERIEKQLENIYNGEDRQRLMEEDFTREFNKIINYINDISNGFENAMQEGIKSERLKTELITNVSHDIKTPLTSIINYVDLLKKENIDNEKAKEYIDILENKSLRLKRLTEDLIEASKVSSGNVQLNLEKINIGELINQTTGEFEDRFKQRGLETIVKFPEEDVFIEADSRYMYRIIENLFSNIAKYASSNSRVYLDIFIKEGNVNICIKNISEEKLNISTDELMQRFVRGDKSRTTEGSGLRTFNNKKFNRTSKRKI